MHWIIFFKAQYPLVDIFIETVCALTDALDWNYIKSKANEGIDQKDLILSIWTTL